jgi:phage terminase large subunit GpA-like protein
LDTGYATQEAYAFVRGVRDTRLMPIKGVAGGAALIGSPTAVDATASGKKLRRGVKLFPVAVGIAKLEFYNDLKKSADLAEDGVTPIYPAGFVHLPKVDAEYLQQLCAEQLITRRDRNGFAHREWQKMRERNEGLDCRIYARAAAAAAGLDRFEDRHWQELEKQLGAGPPAAAVPTDTPEAIREQKFDGGLTTSGGTKPNPRRVVRSRWMT